MQLSKTIPIIQTLNTQMLFNFKISEKCLNQVIAEDDFPCINYIYRINGLIINFKNSYEELEKYKKIFYDNRQLFSLFKINSDNLFNSENTILSKASCINLIERILKYGKFKNNTIYEFNDEYIAKILFLNVAETTVNEKGNLDNDKNDVLELYLSIITYNQFSNDINNSNYLRLRYLYENYIIKNENILERFKNNYGYSLNNYLIFLQMFLLLGNYNNAFINKNILNDTEDAKEVIKCIEDNLFDYTSKDNRDKIIINSYIPSQILIEKPIIEVNNKYFVINPHLLLNRIHSIFFEKIKNSFSAKKDFSKAFYGPLFENYCRDIAKKYCINSKFRHYEFIDEFSYYINGEEKKSSDFYIVFNDTTIVFEVKSTARYNETTIDVDLKGKEKFIKEEIQYKIIKPFFQIEKRLTEIKTLNPCEYKDLLLSKIQNSKNYYYVVVSDETIINNYLMYNNYLCKIKPTYSNNIPIYLNISEFEYLMMSLYRRKKPIDKVFDHYHRYYYSCNFIDMIIKEKKTFKFDRLNIFETETVTNYMKNILNTKEH